MPPECAPQNAPLVLVYGSVNSLTANYLESTQLQTELTTFLVHSQPAAGPITIVLFFFIFIIITVSLQYHNTHGSDSKTTTTTTVLDC